MTSSIRPAAETVSLLLLNAQLYGESRGKRITRFQVTTTNIRRLSGHNRFVPEEYIAEIQTELQKLDWTMIRFDDTAYGILAMDQMTNWTRLGVDRVQDATNAAVED